MQLVLNCAPCVSIRVVRTQHPKHAKELGHLMDLSEYDCVVLLGGDGLVHEFANGLLMRPHTDFPALAVVPAGGGNGIAACLGFMPKQVEYAALRILRRETKPFDVFELDRAKLPKLYSLISVSYGVISNVDRMSGDYRWMSSFRFTFCTLLALIWLHLHRVTVSCRMVTSSGTKSFDKSNLVCLLVCNGQYLTHDLQFCPFAAVDDGFADVAYLHMLPRFPLLRIFLASENGTHVNRCNSEDCSVIRSGFGYHKTTQLEFEPYDTGDHMLDVDGEFYPAQAFNLKVRPGLLRFMS